MADGLIDVLEPPSTIALNAQSVRDSPSVSAQSRSVALWKAAEYAGLFAFTLLMPRLMRPDLYGRFAALLSIIGLLTMAAALGAQATFGRFVPEFETSGQSYKTRALFTQLFLLRVAMALPLSIGLFLALPYLRAGASQTTAAYGAGAFLCVAVGMVCFQLFYGLNRLGRSLAHDALLRVALIALVLILGGDRNIDRAALALFLAEAGFLAVGVSWTWPYFTSARAIRDVGALRSKLTFGFSFFATTFILMSVWRSGELAVLLFTGKSTEVAYYSVANSVTIAFAALLSQMSALLIPSLTAFHVAGESESLENWLVLSMKYLTIIAAAFAVVVHALGGWLVHTLLGDAYLPVIASLKILVLSLLPVPLVRTAFSVAMVRLETRGAFVVAGTALLVFVLGGAALIPWAGSTGASLAAAAAVTASGVVAALTFRLGPTLLSARYPQLGLALSTALAAFLLPWTGLVNGALAVAIFVALLFGGSVVTVPELRRLASELAAGRRGTLRA